MDYFLTNALTRLRHRGPKEQLEQCRYCNLIVVNDTAFPFEMCVGTEKKPHKPVATGKL